MKVTKWFVQKEDGTTAFNHLEEGWVYSDKPQPIKKEFTNQLAWQNAEWVREHAFLIDGKLNRKMEE